MTGQSFLPKVLNDLSAHHGQSEILSADAGGSAVLDPYLVGGSVAAASLVFGRKFIGIDMERKHVETTRRRIESGKGLEMT